MHQNNEAPTRTRKETKVAPPTQAEREMQARIDYAIAHPRCTTCFRSRCSCNPPASAPAK